MPTYSPHRQHPDLVALGGAIRRLRIERQMSQEALSLAAEIDRSYLGRIERGDSAATLLVVFKLAKALSATAEELMRDAGL